MKSTHTIKCRICHIDEQELEGNDVKILNTEKGHICENCDNEEYICRMCGDECDYSDVVRGGCIGCIYE